MRRLLPALLALVVAGCGSPTTTESSAPPSVPAAPTVGLTEAPPPDAPPAPKAPQTPEATATAPAEDAAGDVAVILRSDGLGFAVDADSVRQLPFERTDQQTAATALERALGTPTAQESGLECGPGPLDSLAWDGFSVYFLDGAFAGWYLSEPAPTLLTTAEGVGLGTTLDDLNAAYGDVSVQDSTIGIEWAGGGLSGILSEDTAAGAVEVIWAGANCIAR